MKPTRNRAFTLAEVLVASTISGFIALVAVGALKAVSDSGQRVNAIGETTMEVRFAARMLAQDLANLYRDLNPENMKLIGASQGSNTSGPPFLTFYTTGRIKARADQPEGDVYEVEYLLAERTEEEQVSGASEGPSMVLLRRWWPNPDRERDPGGVVTPIAENLEVFEIRFFDGEQWGDEWSEEMKSLPRLVEVTLGARVQGRGELIRETILANFARLAEDLAGASAEGGTPEGGQEQQEPAPGASDDSAGEQGGPANKASGQSSGGQEGRQGR